MAKASPSNNIYDIIYDITKAIPYGRVCTYGAMARAIGSTGSARLVGWAMTNAPEGVPSHRVVNRLGLLTGKHHFGGDRMQQLLEAEGIVIKNNQVQDFDKVFWNPQELANL
ncbi:MAG: MGMT family protein [Edaphocola sp.]